MTGIPSSPLPSPSARNNISNQPTTWLICIHVYYSRSSSTRNVEHPESAETETSRPKSNRSGISLAFWARSASLRWQHSLSCAPSKVSLSLSPPHAQGINPVVSMLCSLLTHSLCLVLHRRDLPVHRLHSARAPLAPGSPSQSSHVESPG